jgi:GDP-4-dehydro-6-deoxy-D-mannose reductase
MRVLVTGVTGFVGGHLAAHLLDAGDVVVGLSESGRWSPVTPPEIARQVRLEPWDLVTGPVSGNPQQSVADPRHTWTVNLFGTLDLLEAVQAAALTPPPMVVLVGSGVSYGNPAPEDLPVTEACPLRPNNPYAASKAAADLLGLQQFLARGTRVVVARPFNHAGPRQSETYALSSFAKQVAEIERGRRERIEVGNLQVVRDFTDVRDIVRAYRLLAQQGQPGEVYNIGTGRDDSLASLLEILCGLSRVPVTLHVDPARVRPVDQPRLLADASKLRAHTGWQPSFSASQTLSDMLDYWRAVLDG